MLVSAVTDRPGFGEDESLHVKIDDAVIWESTHPEDGFTAYSAIFTAVGASASLRFENDSPEGDRSVFLDSVSVFATTNALSVVLPSSSADTQPFDFQFLSTPMNFDAAEAECERRNRKLASVHSMAENEYIASLHHNADASTYSGIWIGGSDARDGTGDPENGWSCESAFKMPLGSCIFYYTAIQVSLCKSARNLPFLAIDESTLVDGSSLV